MVKVFVTGASGFLAQHIIKLFIANGYQVIGSVRSAEKGETLKRNFGSSFDYEVVPDMTLEGAFDHALSKNKPLEYVLHTASPCFFNTEEYEKDLIIPASAGTKSILTSIKGHASEVTKVVVTSSDAALFSAVDEQNSALSFDETSWNNATREEGNQNSWAAYYVAKTFAEKLAWEFVKKEKPNFKLAVVNPACVFGPQAFDSEAGKDTLNASSELVNSILKAGPNGYVDAEKGGYIDPRDVARAHLAAVENDAILGKRLYLVSSKFSTQVVLDIINEKFPQLRGKIPTGNPGAGEEEIKTLATTNNDATRKLLGFPLRTMDVSVQDAVNQILQVRGI